MSVETRIIKSAVRKDHTREARAAAGGKMDLAWVRDIVKQCKTAGVACFVKQLGAFPVAVDTRVPNLERWRIVLKDRKGGDMSEWSEDLRVREFPGAR